MDGLEGGVLAFLIHSIRNDDDGDGGTKEELKEDPMAR